MADELAQNDPQSPASFPWEKKSQSIIDKRNLFLNLCGSKLQDTKDRGLLNKDGQNSLDQIKKLQAVDLSNKSVVAFIGASGVGKSTLLNTLLGYRIAATSDIRACTSVVTEFSQKQPEMKRFTAKIEYVDQTVFMEEVKILKYEVVERHEIVAIDDGDDGSLGESSSADALRPAKRLRSSASSSRSKAASAAETKLQAVFPTFHVNDLFEIEATIAKLFRKDMYLSEGVQTIENDDEEEFLAEIYDIVANQGDYGDDADDGCTRTRQYWPLIKLVKIYVDSEVLRTGITLVDLPGVQDYSIARTAVSDSYLENANEVVIVSKVNRIFTDETTVKLAELGYDKQLQYDGRQSIIIVGTHADTLNAKSLRREFSRSLNFTETFDKLSEAVRSYRSAQASPDLSDVEKGKLENQIIEAETRYVAPCIRTFGLCTMSGVGQIWFVTKELKSYEHLVQGLSECQKKCFETFTEAFDDLVKKAGEYYLHSFI
ncbi:hypothetical protein ABW21_db0209046 [Orbilia brochopaga]|nr:hypothetical protein ABW21_db0209046 [Drechslerella brochopaga]